MQISTLAGLRFLLQLFPKPVPDADLDADRPSNIIAPVSGKNLQRFLFYFKQLFQFND
jgi:hypothetical protein